MLKTTGLPDKLVPSRNDSSRSASSRNNNSRPASRRNNGNSKVNGFDVDGNGVEHPKKSGKTSKFQKLSQSRKSKSEKTSKSQNLAKSGKKLSKSGNSINFDAMEVEPKFLTPNVRTTFNRLQLAFIKAPIL